MPKIVDHEAYRRELLERSYAAFVKHGFAACTMRLLAKELKVSTGTLYHYFKGKEDVFEQLIRQQNATWRAEVDSFQGEQPMSYRAMFEEAARVAHERRDRQLLMVEYQRYHPKRAKQLSTLEHGMGTIGRFGAITDQRVVKLLISAMIGSIFMSDAVDTEWFVAQGELLDEILLPRRKR